MGIFIKSKQRIAFEIINYTVLTLLGLLTVYPFFYIMINSVLPEEIHAAQGLVFFPKGFSLASYSVVFSRASGIGQGYKITIYITIVGTLISVILTAAMGYALSKKRIIARKVIISGVVFTMWFGGGLIPTYLLVRDVGMLNTLWALMIPNAISAWNVFLMKNYFLSIPDSLEESAKLDGANDILIFFRIVVPLAKPIIATIALFVSVQIWNNWFMALIYINDPSKYPLQLVLRDIISFTQLKFTDMGGMDKNRLPPSDIVVAAAIVVSILPILFVYPFVQKYFVKGLMIGSLKA